MAPTQALSLGVMMRSAMCLLHEGWLHYTPTSWLLCVHEVLPLPLQLEVTYPYFCYANLLSRIASHSNLTYLHISIVPTCLIVCKWLLTWHFCEVLYRHLFVREKWDLYCCQKATMASIFTKRYIDIARAIWPRVPNSSITKSSKIKTFVWGK